MTTKILGILVLKIEAFSKLSTDEEICQYKILYTIFILVYSVNRDSNGLMDC